MINWKVRLKNKNFWISIIPALALLAEMVADLFGYRLELGDLGNKLLGIVEAIFAVLTILGIVVDPTTKGIEDSERAKGYEVPN